MVHVVSEEIFVLRKDSGPVMRTLSIQMNTLMLKL